MHTRFLNLLFPPLCLHCEEPTAHRFCSGCVASFELIDPHTRCLYCFRENEGQRACPKCKEKKRWHVPVASALDFQGPVETLVKRLKQGKMPYLAKTAAAFMLVQFERLGWQRPDLIVPVPRRSWFQGTHHVTLLAKAFAGLLDLPVCQAVGPFMLKKLRTMEDKVVLLIDDVLSTEMRLSPTIEVLKEGMPKKIYALTFARTSDPAF